MKQDHLCSASLPNQSLLQNQKNYSVRIKTAYKTRILPTYPKGILQANTSVHRISSEAKSFIEEDRETYLVGFLGLSSEICLNTTKINNIYTDEWLCLTHVCDCRLAPQLHSLFILFWNLYIKGLGCQCQVGSRFTSCYIKKSLNNNCKNCLKRILHQWEIGILKTQTRVRKAPWGRGAEHDWSADSQQIKEVEQTTSRASATQFTPLWMATLETTVFQVTSKTMRFPSR